MLIIITTPRQGISCTSTYVAFHHLTLLWLSLRSLRFCSLQCESQIYASQHCPGLPQISAPPLTIRAHSASAARTHVIIFAPTGSAAHTVLYTFTGSPPSPLLYSTICSPPTMTRASYQSVATGRERCRAALRRARSLALVDR